VTPLGFLLLAPLCFPMFLDLLTNRLERLEPRAPLGDVDAQAFRRGVVHHGEYGHTAFVQGEANRGVDGLHRVGPLGQDRAVVALRLDRLRLPLQRQQIVLAHQPQHPAHRRANFAHTKPRPHLAVAFTMEGQLLDGPPDLGQEVIIAVASLRAALGRRPQAEGPPVPLVNQVLLPNFESLSASRQEGVAPLAESGGSDAIVAARGLQIGATKQLQNNARFALGGASTPCQRGRFPDPHRSPSGSLKRARKPKH